MFFMLTLGKGCTDQLSVTVKVGSSYLRLTGGIGWLCSWGARAFWLGGL